MNVNIKSLVINVNFAGAAASATSATPSGPLMALLAKLLGQKDEASAAPESDAHVASFTSDAVLDFIEGSEDGKRTLAEIVERFSDVPLDVVSLAMATLAAFGVVRHAPVASGDGAETTFSVPDGDTPAADVAAENKAAADAVMATQGPVVDGEGDAAADVSAQFGVNVADGSFTADHVTIAPSASTSNEVAPLDAADLVGFISGGRYTMRTAEAIERNLPGSAAVLQDAISTGVIGTKRRRSDGAALYYVVPELNVSNLVTFLHSSPRYTMRSVAAVAKHFATSEDKATGLIAEAVVVGAVAKKRNRATGRALYKAVVSAYAAPAAVAQDLSTPELTVVNLRSFIGSDPRYTQRTKSALATHFGVSPDSEELGELLAAAVEEGDLTKLTRRADGAALYSVA